MNNEKHFPHMLSRWILSTVTAVALCPAVSAQTALEYFWNDDPGLGHGTIVYQTAYDNSGIEFTIDTSNLKQGLNLLGLRANQRGKWSATSYRLVAIRDDSSEDWKAEYFWNDDPGVGNGTQISYTGFDEDGNEFSIDTSSLPHGINLLGLRVNCQGEWSYTSYRMVAIGMDTPDKWKAEYFWNDDPGVGKATSISLGAPDGDNFMSMTLDTSHLRPGLNILGIRADSGNVLSATHTYIINISPSGDNKCEVEYFWDKDPGYGKARKLPNGAIEAGTLVEVDIPTEGIKPGAHTLGIRSLSSYGWSATYTHTIYVPGEKGPGCTYAEYFWGADPGYGKGTPIDIKPGDEVNVEDLTVDFPTEVADEYVLSFRSRSENGWSTTVTKILPHLYVEKIALEADTTVMARGTTMQIRSTVNPTEAFDDRIAWSSSDESVLTVDDSGNVKAVGAGTATIIATALDAHGVTGSIEIEVIVPVEGIAIEPTELKLCVTGIYTLKAKVTPEDATNKNVAWSCEGDAVTIDEEGNLTAIARGEATVTATATDGSGMKGSCKVTVGYLMGDADDDGRLAVNDVVLTARAVVDDKDPKLVEEAVDMNGDNAITVGDLTLVAKSVIEWNPAPATVPAQRRTASVCGNVTLIPDADGKSVEVFIESGIDVTGLQFDVESPEGVKVTAITTATSAKTDNYTFDDGTVRHLSYSTANILNGGQAVARIHLAKTAEEMEDEAILEVKRVFASDFAGNLYQLGAAWTRLDASGVGEVSADGISVSTEGRTVIVTVPDDRYVIFTDMKGVSRRMAMTKGINRFEVPAGGVYAVDGIKIIIK